MADPEKHTEADLGKTTDHGPPGPVSIQPVPRCIGRYRVERILGEGTFGRVYLAYDEELGRRVAVKVARRLWTGRSGGLELFLREARSLASLDHPHIVPVYDIGTTPDGLPYIVSKLIQGRDLAQKIQAARPSFAEAVELVAGVAEALHHAHTRGLVHRDVKPANILLDAGERPYLADFGVALRSEDFGRACGLTGTPAYMSPELARGEGHQVDGRSDVFSLGVVLYELLTGRRPFQADTVSELLDQVATAQARPPRQVNDAIPAELERICLKAVAQRLLDRYTTARDFADDLRRYRAATRGPRGRGGDTADLLHLVWDQLDPGLQDAFLLAYNKKLREGSGRISTRDLFQALVRIQDDSLHTLLQALPAEALPEPVAADVPVEHHVLDDAPLLSDCVADSLEHFRQAQPLPRKVAPADLLVDIGKHGHGPSVARLRRHGVTPEELERQVRRCGLSVLRRKPEGHGTASTASAPR